MRTSQDGINLIKKYEGLSLVPYKCPAQLNTIGYGHVIAKGEIFKPSITEQEAEMLLKRDLIKFEQAVLKLISVPLSQNQFDALVSFTFNVGAAALQRSTLRMQINRNEMEYAAETFKRYVYAGKSKLKGLAKRREEESQLFQGNTSC